jgi:hypothetical protein
MDQAMLSADCGRCAGLCCVALTFDRSSLFGFDKRAGEVCRHLQPDCRCRIHAELERRGFAGCARYDCLGAGQRVTQEIFGGRSWRTHPELLRPMLEAFRALRLVHGQLLLLREAGQLRLTPRQRRRRKALLHALQPEPGWSPAALLRFEAGTLPAETRRFLRSLRSGVTSGNR